MSEAPIVYVFRSLTGNVLDDRVLSAAAAEHVTAAFGGGGLFGEGGLARAFAGCVVFTTNDTEERYFGVWGARKASRFRAALRMKFGAIDVRWTRPPTHRIVWETRVLELSAARRRHRAIHGPEPLLE